MATAAIRSTPTARGTQPETVSATCRSVARRWSAASPVSDQELDERFGPPERAIDGRSICVVECCQDQRIVCADPYLVQPAAPAPQSMTAMPVPRASADKSTPTVRMN